MAKSRKKVQHKKVKNKKVLKKSSKKKKKTENKKQLKNFTHKIKNISKEPTSEEDVQIKKDYDENIQYVTLIDIIRNTSKESVINDAFEKIAQKLLPRMQRIVSKFNIPGYSPEDVYQESLYALRFKAIKDYDIDRGTIEGPAPFERFAILCIRRHLSTEFKASYQNKKKVLNSSMSLDQEHSGKDENLSLVNIVHSKDPDIVDSLCKKENYNIFMTTLIKSLSKFEKEVFYLYVKKLSYEEITDKINERRIKVKVNVKAIDNSISRLKKKALEIFDEINDLDKDE